jgi:hypothetical protein
MSLSTVIGMLACFLFGIQLGRHLGRSEGRSETIQRLGKLRHGDSWLHR